MIIPQGTPYGQFMCEMGVKSKNGIVAPPNGAGAQGLLNQKWTYSDLMGAANTGALLKWVNGRSNGKKLAWTFGGRQRNLLQWKGQSAKNVFSVFGKPDKNNGFVRGTTADWDYYVMNIRDSINGLHTRVRFKMNNGVVQEIRLLD